VLELMEAGGPLMWPLLACSLLATTIVIDRLWVLRRRQIVPRHLLEQVWDWHRQDRLDAEHIEQVRGSSPLGHVLAAALVNRQHSREIMKDCIDEAGRQVVVGLERHLNTLGTIASITPLLGLLGTVIGMIKVFTAIVGSGIGDPTVLAGGISEALITTATGLSIAIPAYIFHRYFEGLVDQLAVDMEAQALKMVEIMQGQREND
jgi:biopolymer transport protein ExbB